MQSPKSKPFHERPMLSDTSPEVAEMQLELLRKMAPEQRLGMALKLSSDVIWRAKQAIARTQPELTPREVDYRFVELHYGPELADALRQRDAERVHEPNC